MVADVAFRPCKLRRKSEGMMMRQCEQGIRAVAWRCQLIIDPNRRMHMPERELHRPCRGYRSTYTPWSMHSPIIRKSALKSP